MFGNDTLFTLAGFSRVLASIVRRTWLVIGVTVVVCAGFAAHAASALVGARYLDDLPASAHHHDAVRVIEAAPAPTRDASALVTRNMFCSTCTLIAPVTTPGSTSSLFSPDAVLIATSVGLSMSFATLRVPATEVQGEFAVGDIVPGLGALTRIGFQSVDVRAPDGRIGTLTLSTSTGGRPPTGAATPDPAAAPLSAIPEAIPEAFADRVHRIDDTTFEVERALVRDLVSGTPATAGARIVPVAKNGVLEGLRLSSVRTGSLASAVGLHNGDTLVAINNTKIESANTLLDIYAQLERLDHVELAGTRGGKPLTLTLRLR